MNSINQLSAGEREVEFVAVAGATLWTTCTGKGPALVACHGGPGMWDYLEPVAQMVDDLVTVYRYDQRACGRSTGEADHDVLTAVADIEALRVHWRQDKVIVLGHSWGASLALAYALVYPEHTRALIYISGTGIDPAWHVEYHTNQDAAFVLDEQQRLQELGRQLREEGEREDLRRAYNELYWSAELGDDPVRARVLARGLVEQVMSNGLRINMQVNKTLGKRANIFFEHEQMAQRVATLTMPALFIHGGADPRPARFSRELASLLPHTHYVELPHVGHWPWVEQPQQFRAILREFLIQLQE